MLRIISIIMFLLLLLCVAVQYNDPDGPLWMAIYAYGAVVTAYAIAKRYSVAAPLGFAGYLAGFLYWLPGVVVENPSHLFTDLQMGHEGVEEAREAFGLFLCAVWMLVLSVAWLRSRKRTLIR